MIRIIILFLIFFIACLALTFILTKIFTSKKIDFVYTWVEEYDPEREHYSKILLNKEDHNLDPSRYDQNDELKYSIRSVEQNCPWYRNIYIVVKDGQKPNFLNFNNKRIILVNHSEIMPSTSLPTFNSLAIEANIHKIKGLSDFYIYMNDDFFIAKPLEESNFVSNNTPIVNITKESVNLEPYISYSDTYNFTQMYDISMNLANKITFQDLKVCATHVPSICCKQWDIEFENILKTIDTKHGQNLWDYTVHSKFRRNDNAAINDCMRTIFYIYKGAKRINYLNETKYVYLDNNICLFDMPDNMIFLCVNKVSNECRDKFKQIISEKFNIKSSFE